MVFNSWIPMNRFAQKRIEIRSININKSLFSKGSYKRIQMNDKPNNTKVNLRYTQDHRSAPSIMYLMVISTNTNRQMKRQHLFDSVTEQSNEREEKWSSNKSCRNRERKSRANVRWRSWSHFLSWGNCYYNGQDNKQQVHHLLSHLVFDVEIGKSVCIFYYSKGERVLRIENWDEWIGSREGGFIYTGFLT